MRSSLVASVVLGLSWLIHAAPLDPRADDKKNASSSNPSAPVKPAAVRRERLWLKIQNGDESGAFWDIKGLEPLEKGKNYWIQVIPKRAPVAAIQTWDKMNSMVDEKKFNENEPAKLRNMMVVNENGIYSNRWTLTVLFKIQGNLREQKLEGSISLWHEVPDTSRNPTATSTISPAAAASSDASIEFIDLGTEDAQTSSLPSSQQRKPPGSEEEASLLGDGPWGGLFASGNPSNPVENRLPLLGFGVGVGASASSAAIAPQAPQRPPQTPPPPEKKTPFDKIDLKTGLISKGSGSDLSSSSAPADSPPTAPKAPPPRPAGPPQWSQTWPNLPDEPPMDRDGTTQGALLGFGDPESSSSAPIARQPSLMERLRGKAKSTSDSLMQTWSGPGSGFTGFS